MKKKLSKQKRKLFLSIMAIMLVLSIVVFITISVNILSNEKQKLKAEAYTAFVMISRNASYNDDGANMNYSDYLLNGSDKEENVHVRISDVTDTNDDLEKIVAETRNAVAVDFYDENKYDVFGTIEYDVFRNMLTDEQYETICDYITREENENNEYYLLVCTEYYQSGTQIIPKVIEIVLTKPENDWYAQDTVIEHYELNPTVLSSDNLYKSPDDKRNIIETDFILGNYEVEPHLDKVDEFYETFDYERYYSTHIENPFPLRTGPFTYLIYYNDYISGYHQVEDIDNVDVNYASVNADDVVVFGLTEHYAYSIRYAKEINILEGCIDTIIMMLIYIFILFAIVGVIIGAISWHTLKKQIEQEHRLRTVTNAMAHELKTPLFIIGGYCDNLMENINTEKHEHYAYVISQQTQEMNELVVKMLEYSKLDSASFEPNFEEFNFTELTKELVGNYQIYDITFECDKDIIISADKRLLGSVIENLIDNAIKYTTDIDRISVTIKNGIFSVSNPCDKLTKQEIDMMWQPYHRNANDSNAEGFGLGLAIVKSVLDLHNLKHSAKYDDNSGCITFEFQLPKNIAKSNN